jgi:hypothetical protein
MKTLWATAPANHPADGSSRVGHPHKTQMTTRYPRHAAINRTGRRPTMRAACGRRGETVVPVEETREVARRALDDLVSQGRLEIVGQIYAQAF